MDICATHAGLVHDVTDTDRPTQNDSAHGCLFATSKCRFGITRPNIGGKTAVSLSPRPIPLRSFRTVS